MSLNDTSITPEQPGSRPSTYTNKKLSVGYRPWKKLLLALMLLFLMVIAWFGLAIGIFLTEIMALALIAMLIMHPMRQLMTREISFYPDRIVKSAYFGETTLPVAKLVMIREGESIVFFHGAMGNIRESITIPGHLISTQNWDLIMAYAQQIYQVKPYFSGALRSTMLAYNEFSKAVSIFRVLACCSTLYLLAYLICGIYITGEYEVFNGLATTLPAQPARLFCIALAVAAYLLMKRLATDTQDGLINKTPVMARCQQAYNRASACAFVACGVAGLGLPLSLAFGDKLDFYLFFLVGLLYFYDFYPRLSTWDRIVDNLGSPSANDAQTPGMPRRSLQVSLVLLGTLSLLTYGSNRPILPADNRECKDEQGNPKACDGHSSGSHGSSSSYRGDDGRSTRTGTTGNVRRGGFGSFGSFHGFFGG